MHQQRNKIVIKMYESSHEFSYFLRKMWKNSKSHPAVSWDRGNCHHLIARCPVTFAILSAERCIYLFTVTEPVGLPRKLFNSAGTGQLQRPWSAKVSWVLTGIPFQVRDRHTLHIPQQEEFCNRNIKYKKLCWEQVKKTYYSYFVVTKQGHSVQGKLFILLIFTS